MSPRARQTKAGTRAAPPPARQVRERPTPDAARLLAALAMPGSHAEAEPGSTRLRIVRQSRGVSLGGGRYALDAAEELVRLDLAAWRQQAGRAVLLATDSGRAHQARRVGGEAPFASQHRLVEEAPIGPDRESVAVNHAESPLAWLRRRKADAALFGPASFEAGERLRRDLTIAATMPRMTAAWDANGAAGPGAPPDQLTAAEHVVAARQRVARALAAVGPQFSGLLVDVCGFLKGLQQVEAERLWPARSAKVVLALALERLAGHYGIAPQASGPAQSRGIRSWNEGAPGQAVNEPPPKPPRRAGYARPST